MTSFFLPKSKCLSLLQFYFATHTHTPIYIYTKKINKYTYIASFLFLTQNIIYYIYTWVYFFPKSQCVLEFTSICRALNLFLQWIVFCMWMHHDLFHQVSIVGHLCCFQYFAFKNNASVNNFVYILGFFSPQIYGKVSSGLVGIAAVSSIEAYVILLRNTKALP